MADPTAADAIPDRYERHELSYDRIAGHLDPHGFKYVQRDGCQQRLQGRIDKSRLAVQFLLHGTALLTHIRQLSGCIGDYRTGSQGLTMNLRHESRRSATRLYNPSSKTVCPMISLH